jgi:hypothetical protein
VNESYSESYRWRRWSLTMSILRSLQLCALELTAIFPPPTLLICYVLAFIIHDKYINIDHLFVKYQIMNNSALKSVVFPVSHQTVNAVYAVIVVC